MQPTTELIDDIYRDRVLRARQVDPVEKMLDGPRLFDQACKMMRAGIQNQFPDADADRVRQILAQRVDRIRQLDEHGIYQPWEPPS